MEGILQSNAKAATTVGPAMTESPATPTPVKVLLVEDNPDQVLLMRVAMGRIPGMKFALTHVNRLGDGLARLAQEEFDAVLLESGTARFRRSGNSGRFARGCARGSRIGAHFPARGGNRPPSNPAGRSRLSG